MKIFKRNAVILTVLLFVCVAVYLNWSYNRGLEATNVDPGDTALVNSGENKNDDDSTNESNNTESPYYNEEKNNNTETVLSEYFSAARLTRQQARDSAVSLLQEAAASETASQEVINQAAMSIAVMANYAVVEAQIENLLKAKGFEECVAFMSGDSINIVVPAPIEGLGSTAVSQITDIVMSQSGYGTEKTKIIEVK